MFEFFRKFQDELGNPPWNYYFLQNLPENEYPKYLAKLYKIKTGERLNLKHPKTFNEKIQWIKLYGVTPLMRECTDKVKVRDYVKERIGEEYLKPVLQIIPNESKETMRCHCEQTNNHLMSARQSTDRCNNKMDCHADIEMSSSARLRFPKFQFRENRVLAEYNDGEPNDVSTYFDKINFDKLPDSFVIKTNHGCKWQYIIKDKKEFLQNKQLFEFVKKNMTGWLEQDYSFWGGFEMQYRGIEPKLVLEEFIGNEKEIPKEVEIYCFNGIPKIIKKVHNDIPDKLAMYDENFNCIDLKFLEKEFLVNSSIDELIKQTFVLSKQLSKDFTLVRIDWLIYQNKIYFSEMTFTPNSGLIPFDKNWNKKLGSWIDLEGR